MRVAFVCVLLLPSVSAAQTKEMIQAVEQRLATLKWVQEQQDPAGGFYAAPQDPKSDTKPVPSLRATSAAVRTWKYLGGEQLGSKFPNKDKHAAFVLTCYDPKTGAFAEPGGKPDVAITSVGVMAAMELGIPKEKFAKAMDYLKENAKTFEEVRIAAAGVEAWGVKDCPFKLDDWVEIADKFREGWPKDFHGDDLKNGLARDMGSFIAMWFRLGNKVSGLEAFLNDGQRDDGGWGKKGEKASDMETTYRVMRAFMWLKQMPKDVKKLREFLAAHRNTDNGYATKPGDKSNMSGAYYNAIVSKWLDDLEAKK